MSAKTKAKELINEMRKYQHKSDFSDSVLTKHCANVVCDEILSLLTLYNPDNAYNDLQTKKFWNEVKNEINNFLTL